MGLSDGQVKYANMHVYVGCPQPKPQVLNMSLYTVGDFNL